VIRDRFAAPSVERRLVRRRKGEEERSTNAESFGGIRLGS
jgi:hypothetical protein